MVDEYDDVRKTRYSAEVERALAEYRKYQGGSSASSSYQIRYEYAFRFDTMDKAVFDEAAARGCSDEQAYAAVKESREKRAMLRGPDANKR